MDMSEIQHMYDVHYVCIIDLYFGKEVPRYTTLLICIDILMKVCNYMQHYRNLLQEKKAGLVVSQPVVSGGRGLEHSRGSLWYGSLSGRRLG